MMVPVNATFVVRSNKEKDIVSRVVFFRICPEFGVSYNNMARHVAFITNSKPYNHTSVRHQVIGFHGLVASSEYKPYGQQVKALYEKTMATINTTPFFDTSEIRVVRHHNAFKKFVSPRPVNAYIAYPGLFDYSEAEAEKSPLIKHYKRLQ